MCAQLLYSLGLLSESEYSPGWISQHAGDRRESTWRPVFDRYCENLEHLLLIWGGGGQSPDMNAFDYISLQYGCSRLELEGCLVTPLRNYMLHMLRRLRSRADQSSTELLDRLRHDGEHFAEFHRFLRDLSSTSWSDLVAGSPAAYDAVRQLERLLQIGFRTLRPEAGSQWDLASLELFLRELGRWPKDAFGTYLSNFAASEEAALRRTSGQHWLAQEAQEGQDRLERSIDLIAEMLPQAAEAANNSQHTVRVTRDSPEEDLQEQDPDEDPDQAEAWTGWEPAWLNDMYARPEPEDRPEWGRPVIRTPHGVLQYITTSSDDEDAGPWVRAAHLNEDDFSELPLVRPRGNAHGPGDFQGDPDNPAAEW